MRAVKLHAVKTGHFCPDSGPGKIFNRRRYFIRCHLTALTPLGHDLVRRPLGFFPFGNNKGVTAGMTDLHDDFPTGLVHGVCNTLQPRDHVIRVNTRLHRPGFSRCAGVGITADDKAHFSECKRLIQID